MVPLLWNGLHGRAHFGAERICFTAGVACLLKVDVVLHMGDAVHQPLAVVFLAFAGRFERIASKVVVANGKAEMLEAAVLFQGLLVSSWVAFAVDKGNVR